jgi:hypothetical protein
LPLSFPWYAFPPAKSDCSSAECTAVCCEPIVKSAPNAFG